MILSSQLLHSIQIRMLIGAIHRMTLKNIEEQLNANQAALSHLQFGLLMMLSHQEQTSSELSRTFGLDPSTLVPTVDALVKKGYLIRGTDPNDRRRSPLLVTENGQQIINETLQLLDNPEKDFLSTCLQRLGDEKREKLTALLEELVALMPDGENVLKGITERTNAYQRVGSSPEHCRKTDTGA